MRDQPAANAYVVGFSGGADSTALLHALNTVKDQLDAPIAAVHVNHGLHPDADAWQSHCQRFCDQQEIELTCVSIELSHQSGKGLEAEARQKRYQVISSFLEDGGTLLTAHHADDQAETLLLNLMRGSGVDGLSAMPERRRLGNGFLQRPLLDFQNDDLIDYLNDKQIEWTDDPSNQYLNHDRNFVRHEVIPLMSSRWPSVNKRLLLTCKAMTDSRDLLEQLADDYLEPNLCHPDVLQLTPQLLENNRLFRLVVRRWAKKSEAPALPARRLAVFTQQVSQSGVNNKAVLSWGGWRLHSYHRKLWLLKDIEISKYSPLVWSQDEDQINLGEAVGWLSMYTAEKDPGMRFVGLEGLSVTYRSELIFKKVDFGGHHKSLKNLFQKANIPTWLRDYIPLCEYNNELVAVGDWCFSQSFGALLKQRGVIMEWKPKHSLLQFVRDQMHLA